MRLDTKPGEMVRFLGKNGYEGELTRAKDMLEVGQLYEVASMSVGGFRSSVTLKDGGSFNSVMFENVGESQ